MSMWFYGYNNIKYLAILVVSILLNYLIVELMYKFGGGKAIKRLLFVAGLVLNIGILFYFKYYDFFIENVNTAFKTNFSFLSLALPLGISFYTFQQLSYVIDSYNGECENYSLLEYAAYVSFFPQLIAGPIVYHSELIPQLKDEKNHRLNYENLRCGLYTFSLGLAKKVLIADTFSQLVNIGYGDIRYLNNVSVIVVMICYSFQIYFDFSGYCDMACGIGYMFNIELPINFNSPYKAASISEFWDRWHMTLTRFFTKYVYIPLGGSRRGKIRTYLNVLIVFLVSGIWHGANWTFIYWGILNGIGNVFDRVFGRFFRWVPKAIKVVVTFMFTTFAWSLFRASSFAEAKHLWEHLDDYDGLSIYESLTEAFNNLLEMQIIYRAGFGRVIDALPWLPLVIFMLVVMFACFFMRNTQEKAADGKYDAKRMAVTVILIIWSVLSLSNVSEFLYFNF
jgi:D-alanyl-lipoteichoic acid acyltransferase DltB (MBOAT superfamily)